MVEPRTGRLQSLTATLAGVRVEAEDETDLRRRDPDRRQVGDALAERVSKHPRAEDRPPGVNLRSWEVDLADEAGVERGLSPPVAGFPVGEGPGREQEEGARTERLQAPNENDHVLPVLGGRGRPRSRDVRSEHLVERDPRGRAGRRGGGTVEDAVGPVLDRCRLHRLRRRPDSLFEVHLPEDGLRPQRSQLRGIDEVRGSGDDAGPREHRPVRNRAVCEVDPDGRPRRQPALASLGPAGRSRDECDAREAEDEEALHRLNVRYVVGGRPSFSQIAHLK